MIKVKLGININILEQSSSIILVASSTNFLLASSLIKICVSQSRFAVYARWL